MPNPPSPKMHSIDWKSVAKRVEKKTGAHIPAAMLQADVQWQVERNLQEKINNGAHYTESGKKHYIKTMTESLIRPGNEERLRNIHEMHERETRPRTPPTPYPGETPDDGSPPSILYDDRREMYAAARNALPEKVKLPPLREAGHVAPQAGGLVGRSGKTLG